MENEDRKFQAKRQELAAAAISEAMKLLRRVHERVKILQGRDPGGGVRDELQEAHFEILDAMRMLESQTPATNHR